MDDVRLLVERTGVHPARLTEEGIKAYLDDLLEVRQVAPSTFAQHVAAMRFFFTHVMAREFPILHEARRRRRRVLPDVPTVGEVQAVLHALRLPQLFTLCATLYGCGVRRKEGLVLAVEDIDRGRGLLHVRDGKGGSDRFVPIPAAAAGDPRRAPAAGRHRLGAAVPLADHPGAGGLRRQRGQGPARGDA